MNTFNPITKIKGAYLIERKSHKDNRGSFERLYCSNTLKEKGLPYVFPQVNLSSNHLKGTLRGMHFQREPYAETKIVSCVKGAVYDVLVDLRDKNNIQWEGFYLTEGDGKSVYIPKGVAHGYLTLVDDSTVVYLVDQEYVQIADGGVCWDDPSIGINWPFNPIVISDKDKSFKHLK